jgi:hypothetical protein
MANYSDAIHNAIYAALTGFSFPYVTFDPDTGQQSTSEVDGEAPASVIIRPTDSAFNPAIGERRTPRLRERSEWNWEAEVTFNNQISTELYEQTEINSPIFLPRTSELDQQVVVALTETEHDRHPPEHQGSSGTKVTFRYAAQMSRR